MAVRIIATRRLLRATWQLAEHHLFNDVGRAFVRASDVREFMRSWMDDPQELAHRASRMLWMPLSEEEKQAAILDAFPDTLFEPYSIH